MKYWVKSPLWLQKAYPQRLWKKPPSATPTLYLTFDDGPEPEITPWVLDQLKKYEARATFFCVGQNVGKYPEVIARLKQEGHTLGNHTYSHLNNWKTSGKEYLRDVEQCAAQISIQYFRPPYGRLQSAVARQLRQKGYTIVMWDVLSGDFDVRLQQPQSCFENIRKHAGNGSIVVFHDSQKAWLRLSKTLPQTLEYFSEKGYHFKSL